MIARIPIVTIIKAKGVARRNFVGVGKIKNFAAQRGVPGHRIFGHGQDKFLIGKFQTVILREHKTQVLALAILLDKIEGAGVGRGNFARLREN